MCEAELVEILCKNCNHPIEPVEGGWMHELEALNEDGSLGGCKVMQRYVVGDCGCTNPEPNAPLPEPTSRGNDSEDDEGIRAEPEGEVRKCPKCQSTDIVECPALENDVNIGQIMACRNCQHHFDIEDAGVTSGGE